MMKILFLNYLRDETGATAIEYALVAALIAVGIIAGATAIGTAINALFTGVDSDIEAALTP